MVDHSHSHHFHFLKNREIDSLYFMNALRMFAVSLVEIFVPIYFYKLGIPIWAIITFWLIRAVFYIIFTYLSLPLIRRLSDKMMMFIGVPFLVIYFLLLNQISGLGVLFFLTPITVSLYAIFFWAGYHLDFSSAADQSDEGEEIGINYVIMDITRFITPLIGGILIASSGFHFTFIIASILLILSVIPLWFFPRRSFSKNINIKSLNKALKDNVFSNFRKAIYGYVTDKMIITTVWPIFIFIAVGSVNALGEYMSIGLFAGAVATYTAGKLSDKGDGSKLFNITGTAESLVWFVRSIVRSFGAIIGTHVVGYIFRDAMLSSWMSKYYKLLDDVEDSTIYILAHEMFYNIARMIIYPIFILLAYLLVTEAFFTVAFILGGVLSLLIIFGGR